MNKFKDLLSYREYYVYDAKREIFCIATGEHHEEATKLYTHLVDTYFPDAFSRWKFEIALDCVHNFSEEEIQIIIEQGEIVDYYFGYGMYVRNHYIHKSKKHRSFFAEEISDRIEKLIYTIVLPSYNCFSEQFMVLTRNLDFRDIRRQYEDTQPIIQEMLTKLADDDNEISANEALQTIKATIRKNLGPDGFKNIALPIIQAHMDQHKHIMEKWEEWSENLYRNTTVHTKEYNQFRAIYLMNVFLYTAGSVKKLKNIDDTQLYIMENLGLSQEDALRMAECAIVIGRMHDKIEEEETSNPT